MAVNTQSELKVGDIVTHTGKRGFWPISNSHKGVGLIMSPLYQKGVRMYVHDVWFVSINQMQQIGAKALERINGGNNEVEHVGRTNLDALEK